MNIGEAAKASSVSAKMIRYYESVGLIPAADRTTSGYRVYSATDVEMLRFIRRSRDLGFTVEKIEELLALWRDRSRHSADVKRIALEQIEGLERKILEMQSMMDSLRQLADACCGDHRPDCPILADLGRGATQRNEQVRTQFNGLSSLRTAAQEPHSR
ncbi:Cu(I)-responsive transcriptional regulator [Cypionkella psychrotolerans]|uniref:Cu(I)-responsive transcriptional regulator n=1 Tax=Cypionkella psychrotolerans TaxID=1678131 RepID=UPI0009E89DE9|nr:Cu(I)-responsive transcriptional regulator [Cypionkella psychrotolerans]